MTTQRDSRLPVHDEERVARYLASGAWSGETTVERFRAVAQRHGASEAVAGLDGRMTYAELDGRSDQVAAWLIDAGLPVGGATIVQVGNSVESVLAFYSLLKAAAVPVAALAAHRSHEIGNISDVVQPAAHLVDSAVSSGALIDVARENSVTHPSVRLRLTVGPAPEGFVRLMDVGHDVPLAAARRRVDGVQDQIRAEDVAVFQLSGGTTGTPKIIPRLHAEYWNNANVNSRALQRTSTSRIAHVLPILHNAGVINALFGAHAVGGCVVALPFTGAEETLSALIDNSVTEMMVGSPMMPWLDHALWPKVALTFDRVIWSGSKPPTSVSEWFESQGIWMGQTWGMAEGPYTSTRFADPANLRQESVGTPVFGEDDEMIIVDVTSHVPLPAGQTGMLAFRGPSTLAGYYAAPEHDDDAFTADGFLLTGDLARLIEHAGVHFLSIEGRNKDVISRGGEKFSTEEVEKLLRQHPAIVEAAVVAMPDARLGERACAYLALADSALPLDLAQVQHHFAALGVAKFKWPERIEILDVLPRTPTYKIDKLLLRRRIAEQLTVEERGSSRSAAR